jgi:hypothetical protein
VPEYSEVKGSDNIGCRKRTAGMATTRPTGHRNNMTAQLFGDGPHFL